MILTSVLTQAVQYDLVVIEDMPVPLIGEMPTQSSAAVFPGLFWIMAAVVAAAAVAVYLMSCQVNRSRVLDLMGRYHVEGYHGWNLTKLGREVSRLESDALEICQNGETGCE